MSKARGAKAKKQTEHTESITNEEVPNDSKSGIKKELQEEVIKLEIKVEVKTEEVVEKRVLRPKRSYSSLPKAQPQAPAQKPPTAASRKRKNSAEKVEIKKEEIKKEMDTSQDLKETSGKKTSKHKIPVLFEDSPDENQENEPEKKTKPRGRKPSATKLKKTSSASNLGLSVSATASAIVNSGISCTSSIVEDIKPAPKSIMKSKENKMEQDAEDSKKPKRGVRIQDATGEKSELDGVKCDKHKYSASTSTPSGLRRKPLKLPQDVSMICTETVANTTS